MPFSFFLFVFYTFKKTACDESAERSQGDERTRREKTKSRPNWISSFTKVCFFFVLTFLRVSRLARPECEAAPALFASFD